MKFSKKDLFFAIITGLLTGVIAWRIFVFLGKDTFFGIPTISLIVIIPILWIVGVSLGYFLGRWMKFFNQFGKFVAVGFTNFTVDSGVLYLLIGLTGEAAGIQYAGFKAISFLCAVMLSYVWNRNWVFGAKKNPAIRQEFVKFFGVNIGAIVVNLAVAFIVVNVIKPHFGITLEGWAGVGAIVGSACALLLSFVGFKKAVFPSQTDEITINNDTNPVSNLSS
jgi:putative flippase GtrA